MIGADVFKRGMRRLGAGVSVITTALDGNRHGLVATSVTSVSVDPATRTVRVGGGCTWAEVDAATFTGNGAAFGRPFANNDPIFYLVTVLER